jgi:periplasmic protein TonB
MYETEIYEPDAEFEQALYAALAREAAPPDLLARVIAQIEDQLIEAQPAVPSFRVLTFPARSAWSSFWSIGAHAAAFALIVLVVFAGGKAVVTPSKAPITAVDVRPWIPMNPGKDAMGGGGGGGAHEIVEASRGHLPKLSATQITPPQLIRNEAPKLPVEATIVAPQLKLPDEKLPDMGMPQSPQVSLASQGPGSGSGFGSGNHGGIGPGNGNGYGPGSDGGYGGGVMHVGRGVSEPRLIYSVDPEFSDEARRAKYQGVCIVSVIVDAQGNPQHVHVARPLGMGLDEKAVEAVREYKFKPAYYQGHPVAVEIDVVVNFRIY